MALQSKRGDQFYFLKPPNATKVDPKHPKNSLYVVLLFLKFNDDL
jgi:hypothetical protein